jgi:hypothetical protein
VKIRSGFILLSFALTAHAAELKPETLRAWQEYVQSAIARMQEHLCPENHFLNIDKEQDSAKRVRNGEILISPSGPKSLTKFPSGLIHDWLGTTFVAHATLNDVLSIVRDYDQYKEFYRPTVIDSKALAKGGREDRFSMVLLNKSVFLKTALDTDYKCSYVSVSDRRWYSTSEATRIQEIENYGTPDQRVLREDEGHGFLWRLFSITRFEERDGGVYIEFEAIALSRDIPFSLRWIVEPIVRRISISSLTTSLRQTENAVHPGAALARCNTPGASCSKPAIGPSASMPISGAAVSLR